MRTLLKITVPVEAGNKALQDGSLPRLVHNTLEALHPEAAYFCTEAGQRAAFMVFDLKDPAEIPVIAEPLFLGLNAQVEFLPVMNAQDLQNGLTKLPR